MTTCQSGKCIRFTQRTPLALATTMRVVTGRTCPHSHQGHQQGMTTRRADIQDLPDWPRGLSLEQAAAYVGVSPPVFLKEVKEDKWPPCDRRGQKATRLVWDRRAIDRCYDLVSGLAGNYSAVVGSITVRTRAIVLAGNPPFWACILTVSSSGAL